MKHLPDITRHTVPRETFAAVDELVQNHQDVLEKYLDELFWWNKRINLVSRNVPRETIREHIRHSLLLHSFDVFKNAGFIVDAGSGGGLPGIPLAITHPSKTFLLNDIAAKKMLAVKQMSQKLGTENVSTAAKSIAETEVGEPFLLISKHAFKINDLFTMTRGMPWTEMAFYKGRDFESELAGISLSLDVTVHELSREAEHPFYEDKVLIVVSRKL